MVMARYSLSLGCKRWFAFEDRAPLHRSVFIQAPFVVCLARLTRLCLCARPGPSRSK